MNELSNYDNFAHWLQATARTFPYPATPNLAARWKDVPNLEFRRRKSRRLALSSLAILILLAIGALAVPSVRAAVLEFLQIGGIRIDLATPTPLQPAAISGPAIPATATPSGTALASLSLGGQLAGETSLERAQAAMQHPILLPGPDSGLGEPDQVFLQSNGGQMMILTWQDPSDPGRLQASLFILEPGVFLTKTEPDQYEPVSVRGQDGLWLMGNHDLILRYEREGLNPILMAVQGNVLIWEEGSLTYRLESIFDLQQSQAIAARMETYP